MDSILAMNPSPCVIVVRTDMIKIFCQEKQIQLMHTQQSNHGVLYELFQLLTFAGFLSWSSRYRVRVA